MSHSNSGRLDCSPLCKTGGRELGEHAQSIRTTNEILSRVWGPSGDRRAKSPGGNPSTPHPRRLDFYPVAKVKKRRST